MAGKKTSKANKLSDFENSSVKDDYMRKPLLNKGLRDIVLVRDSEKVTNSTDGLFRMV